MSAQTTEQLFQMMQKARTNYANSRVDEDCYDWFEAGWNLSHFSRDAEVAELKAKLTESQRLNKVALEAMKEARDDRSQYCVDEHKCCGKNELHPHADDCYLNNAIKELEKP